MKNSYFTTPRSLDECTFHSWGNAIFTETTSETHRDPDTTILIACIVGLVFVLAYLIIERFA